MGLEHYSLPGRPPAPNSAIAGPYHPAPEMQRWLAYVQASTEGYTPNADEDARKAIPRNVAEALELFSPHFNVACWRHVKAKKVLLSKLMAFMEPFTSRSNLSQKLWREGMMAMRAAGISVDDTARVFTPRHLPDSKQPTEEQLQQIVEAMCKAVAAMKGPPAVGDAHASAAQPSMGVVNPAHQDRPAQPAVGPAPGTAAQPRVAVAQPGVEAVQPGAGLAAQPRAGMGSLGQRAPGQAQQPAPAAAPAAAPAPSAAVAPAVIARGGSGGAGAVGTAALGTAGRGASGLSAAASGGGLASGAAAEPGAGAGAAGPSGMSALAEVSCPMASAASEGGPGEAQSKEFRQVQQQLAATIKERMERRASEAQLAGGPASGPGSTDDDDFAPRPALMLERDKQLEELIYDYVATRRQESNLNLKTIEGRKVYRQCAELFPAAACVDEHQVQKTYNRVYNRRMSRGNAKKRRQEKTEGGSSGQAPGGMLMPRLDSSGAGAAAGPGQGGQQPVHPALAGFAFSKSKEPPQQQQAGLGGMAGVGAMPVPVPVPIPTIGATPKLNVDDIMKAAAALAEEPMAAAEEGRQGGYLATAPAGEAAGAAAAGTSDAADDGEDIAIDLTQ